MGRGPGGVIVETYDVDVTIGLGEEANKLGAVPQDIVRRTFNANIDDTELEPVCLPENRRSRRKTLSAE